MSETTRTYPHRIDCGGTPIEIDRMTSRDRGALVDFVAQLPAEDLLFVPRDISHPKVIDAWMRALDRGRMASLVARDGGTLVGCTAIAIDKLGWSRHVGELRVLVSPAGRSKGLGRALVQECFVQAIELGLKKLVAQMTISQRGAIAIFEDLGFRPEALLHHHVADRDGGLHDLVVLSHDVNAVAARHEVFGMGGVTG